MGMPASSKGRVGSNPTPRAFALFLLVGKGLACCCTVFYFIPLTIKTFKFEWELGLNSVLDFRSFCRKRLTLPYFSVVEKKLTNIFNWENRTVLW
jgi:hypothetical protein